MKYTVYKITNELDGKIYIGVHKTQDINDNYMGSGVYIKRAQEKYGIENFTKVILHVFDNQVDMFNMESILVNEEFVKSKDTYNIKLGGEGGWDHLIEYVNSEEHLKRAREQLILCHKKGLEAINWLRENDSEWVNNKNDAFSNTMKEKYLDDYENPFKGRTHSEQTKERMRGKTHQQGSGNSQFGTMWIHNLDLKESKRIPKGNIPDGWLKGRKMKFD